MNGAPDIDAMADRLSEYVLSLRNTAVDPDEPLVLEVFDVVDNAMHSDNAPHQSPRLGLLHDGITFPVNTILSGGFSQEGTSLWRMILLCDSPERLQGMRGPRGARTITKQLIDAINGWTIDEEGECPLSVITMMRYMPSEEQLRDECGYYLEVSHPVFNN